MIRRWFKVDLYRAVRFAPVGMCTGLIDASVMAAVLYIYGREGALAAVLSGACTAYPINFVAHRYITYGIGMTPLMRQIGTFVLFKTPNLTVRVLVACAIMAQMDWGVAAIVLVPLWGFAMTRWIFTGTPPWKKAA